VTNAVSDLPETMAPDAVGRHPDQSFEDGLSRTVRSCLNHMAWMEQNDADRR
jgi:hypothetical protein